jgi:O-antigen/teichoic acid export membrane protein
VISTALASLSRLRQDDLRRQVLGGAFGSAGLKVAGGLIALVLSIVLARTLGPEGFGMYAFAFSLITVLAFPAHLGLPVLVVREVAKTQLNGQWGLLRGLLRWTNLAVLLLSTAIALTMGAVLWMRSDTLDVARLQTLLWTLPLVPLIALGNLRGAVLRGLRRIVQSQLPELMLRPGLFLLLVLAVAQAGSLTPPTAMALHAGAALATFVVGIVLMMRALPPEVRGSAPEYRGSAWTASLMPLSFLAAMQIARQQGDVVLLGLLASEREVGIYRVVSQMSHAVVFGLVIVNAALAPQVARLYEGRDHASLQRLLTWTARLALLGAFPVFLVFATLGDRLIRTIFGVEYVEGHAALAILSAGHLVSVSAGAVILVLTMTGHERDTASSVAIAVALNLMLGFVLIPRFGAEGAAFASAATMIVWNVLLAIRIRQRLGMDSTALGILSHGKQHKPRT